MGHNYYTDGMKTMQKSDPIYGCTVRCQCKANCPQALCLEEVKLSKADAQKQVRAAGWTQEKKDKTWVWISPQCRRSQ